jgi:hypothetical protein
MNWKEIEVSADQTGFEYKGSPLFGRSFTEVLKFHEPGIAPVKDETGAFHIDSDGSEIYLVRYDRTFGFYCRRAAVVTQNRWFHIDENGRDAYSHRFGWTGNYQENVCTVRDESGHYFHIDKDGNRCYDLNFLYAGDFKDGIACVKDTDGFFRHIFKDGSGVHTCQYLDLGVFHKGFATAKDDKGWCHIDRKGRPIYSQRYHGIEPFYNGYALVTKLDGRKAILSESGNEFLDIG